jgi:hypothetical protein
LDPVFELLLQSGLAILVNASPGSNSGPDSKTGATSQVKNIIIALD